VKEAVKEAVKEIDRAYKDLGVKGITLFSNIDFKPISSPEFHPMYAKAEEYGLPIFIHPGVPFTAGDEETWIKIFTLRVYV
jgi:predicted TIM-barrel fold metal-dependent hydrolase